MRNDGNYADRIINLVYPRRCPVCDEPVSAADNLICEECRPKLRYIEGARCRKCGKRLTDETRIYCGDCERRVHIFDHGYALYSYREMHDSIYRFKSKGRCEYARFYAGDICRHLKDEIDTMGHRRSYRFRCTLQENVKEGIISQNFWQRKCHGCLEFL